MGPIGPRAHARMAASQNATSPPPSCSIFFFMCQDGRQTWTSANENDFHWSSWVWSLSIITLRERLSSEDSFSYLTFGRLCIPFDIRKLHKVIVTSPSSVVFYSKPCKIFVFFGAFSGLSCRNCISGSRAELVVRIAGDASQTRRWPAPIPRSPDSGRLHRPQEPTSVHESRVVDRRHFVKQWSIQLSWVIQ